MKQTKAIVIETKKTDDLKNERNVHKERFLGALKENNNRLDQEELGKSLGFSKEYTDKIIEALLLEGKIISQPAGVCRYKPTETNSEK
ncbi:hypothetical protein [Pontibacter chitinilyticus]|uniref:hypothetical protein n=1 Tax=Pontibacter chitinilyticus TaxID=2674989 RepID=UPI00321B6F86